MTTDLDTRQTALYRFYDRSGGPLYFGIAVDPPARWINHVKTEWWTQRDPSRTCVDWYPDRATALSAEASAIGREGPAYNVVHAIRDGALGVQEARAKLRHIVDAAVEHDTITTVLRHGRPVAAVVSYSWLEEAREALAERFDCQTPGVPSTS